MKFELSQTKFDIMTPKNALIQLSRKQFVSPGDFTEEDKVELGRLQLIVFDKDFIDDDTNNTTPESAISAGSESTSDSNKSVKSAYTNTVVSNKILKRQWECTTFEEISTLMDDNSCRNNIQSCANFHATFLNFIRQETNIVSLCVLCLILFLPSSSSSFIFSAKLFAKTKAQLRSMLSGFRIILQICFGFLTWKLKNDTPSDIRPELSGWIF